MRRSRAFTLIELLVVVAIIGLIISILIPSLSAARRQSKTMVCLSNLRQLSHGWHAYADEYRDVSVPGVFPRAAGGTSNPANWYQVGNGRKFRPRWIATMGRFVGLFAFSRPSTSDDRQDYDSRVYQCPEADDWMDERNHAWGYNYQFLGNARQTQGKYHNFPVNRSRIRHFASTVLGADSMGTASGFASSERRPYSNNGTHFAEMGNHAWSLDPPRLTDRSDRGSGDAGSPRTAADPRHSHKVNAIFCDGHGDSMSVKALGYRTLPDGKYVDLETVEELPTNKLFSGTGEDADPPPRPR
jgi:prepilin-type N-terminal cleavage/methylation domain-containing protein/prepilin-type processing-associated H-X9-DG protein